MQRPERAKISTEVNLASCNYLGESWTCLDCHGSIELAEDGLIQLY